MPPRVEVITDPQAIAEQLVKWLDQPDEDEEPLSVRRQQAAVERMEERRKGE